MTLPPRRLATVLIAISLVLVTAAYGLVGSCGSDSKTKEEIALEVAEDWARDSVDEVAEEIVKLIIGEVPLATSLAANLLANQFRSNLEWTYGTPTRESGNRYVITATAATSAEIDLPLVEAKTYTASLPFTLEIEVSDREVTSWIPDITGASISEQTP